LLGTPLAIQVVCNIVLFLLEQPKVNLYATAIVKHLIIPVSFGNLLGRYFEWEHWLAFVDVLLPFAFLPHAGAVSFFPTQYLYFYEVNPHLLMYHYPQKNARKQKE